MATVTKLVYSYRRVGSIGVGVEGPIKWERAYLDYQDFTSIGTINMFILPVRSFVAFCWLAIIAVWGSTGSATMQIDESSGSGTLITSSNLAVAEMTEGTVFKGTSSSANASALATVAGHDDEYDSAERTIDVVVGVEGFNAGTAWLDVGIMSYPAVRA